MTTANEAKYADCMTATQRDDESVASADLISACENSVEEMRLTLAGMTVEQLRSRPAPGQ